MMKDVEIFRGAWRQRRRWVAIALILFLVTAPWIMISGHPFLRIDVLSQKLFLFGFGVFFNELILVVPLLIGILFLILAVTSKWGRVWCGWACPHPVFLEFIYRPYEKWIKRFDFTIPLLKWVGFVVFSLIVGNIFISFIVGPTQVLKMMGSSPGENSGLFTAMLIISGGFLFNFGIFRERMCTTTCPYGRLQSVLLDPNSLVVMYDVKRGEPRGKKGSVSGDCIDCKRCVAVCPTKIDIRNGTQLECIHCTACMDVCDEVMKKVGRSEQLIKYSSQNRTLGISADSRTRQVLYTIAASVLLLFTGFMYQKRELIDVVLFRSTLADAFQSDPGTVQRHVRISVRNKQDHDSAVSFTALDNTVSVMSPQKGEVLRSGEKAVFELFIKVPRIHFVAGVANEKIKIQLGEQSRDITVQLLGGM